MGSLFERIVSFPAQILAELKNVNKTLAEIHATYKGTREKDEREREVLEAALARPDAQSTEDKRHYAAVETFQNRYLYIQIAGLFVTMLIAIATLFSAKAAKDAADAAAEQAKAAWKNIELTAKNVDFQVKQFQQDQRAWILVGDPIKPQTPVGGWPSLDLCRYHHN